MVTVATYLDAEGANAGHIPNTTLFIGAYVSGTGDVPWNQGELNNFPGSHITRIYQGAGAYPGPDGYDMIDVESEAVTPAQAAQLIQSRVNNGYQWTIVYGTDATLQECSAAIQALGESIWNGHVYSFLADWNLNEAEAASTLGTEIHGMTCVGVQWASPSSNPDTVVPGSTETLAQANIDLSVVDATRIILPGKPQPPPPPSAVAWHGYGVYTTSGAQVFSVPIVSNDGGHTWTSQQQ